MDFLKLLIPASVACLCNALANMLWKIRFDKIPFAVRSFQDLTRICFSTYILGGVICYSCSMLLYFYMLSNFKLSLVIPATCMTYIFNIIIAKAVFKESINGMQIIGIVIILLGLVILFKAQAIK